MEKTIVLEDFMILSTRIFNLFGLKMTSFTRDPDLSHTVFKYISVCCVFLLVGQAYVYILVHFGGEGMFLVFTYNLSCIGFGFVLALKVYMLGVRHRDPLQEVIDRLDEAFPKSSERQTKYGTQKYLKLLSVQNGTYGVLMVMLFAYFNFSDILTAIFKFIFIGGDYEKNFTLFMWFPFGYDGKAPVVFEIFYTISVWSGFTCLTINLAFDLMYCSLLAILCMRFEMLKKDFEDFNKDGSKKDLNQLIKDHYELIR